MYVHLKEKKNTIYMTITGHDMIAQKGGKFLEHAEHELIGAADHDPIPITATQKQNTKMTKVPH